ncbi:MAG: DUF58 domain-containing protein [Candidatus Dormibacteraeota bacterium]|nr:DUF58 domain-containing protein [Candidatus Dormibacteraeota bacterium]
MAPRKPNIRDRLGRVHWPVLGSLGVHPAGDYRSRGRGPGLEQADVREYVAGDDPRQIDWNLSARSDRTYVREAHPDRGLDAWLILDTSRSLDWGTARCLKREAAGELVVAASILLARRGNRVGALIFDRGLQHIIPPSTGRSARSTLIAEASRERGPGEDGPTDLTAVLVKAGRIIRRPSLLIVVSDFLAPSGWQQPLKILGEQHELVAAVIGDPRESELPDVGLLTMEDPETGRQLEVDTASRKLRERFRSAAEEQRRELLADLRSARAAIFELSTAEDVLVQLLRIFQRVETGRRGHGAVIVR